MRARTGSAGFAPALPVFFGERDKEVAVRTERLNWLQESGIGVVDLSRSQSS